MEVLYHLIPALSLGLAVLSIIYKLHRRSVSSFLTIIMVALSSNAIYYGLFSLSMIVVFVFTMVIFMRGIMKADNDKFSIDMYSGKEKRNIRRDINAYS